MCIKTIKVCPGFTPKNGDAKKVCDFVGEQHMTLCALEIDRRYRNFEYQEKNEPDRVKHERREGVSEDIEVVEKMSDLVCEDCWLEWQDSDLWGSGEKGFASTK